MRGSVRAKLHNEDQRHLCQSEQLGREEHVEVKTRRLGDVKLQTGRAIRENDSVGSDQRACLCET